MSIIRSQIAGVRSEVESIAAAATSRATDRFRLRT